MRCVKRRNADTVPQAISLRHLRDVAQFGGAPDLGSGGRGFKSRRSDLGSVSVGKGYKSDDLLEYANGNSLISINQETRVRILLLPLRNEILTGP